MPTRPPHGCATVLCPHLTTRRYCDACERERARQLDAERGTSHERGYGAGWRRVRAFVLLRDPVCKSCCREPATEVDHIKPRRAGGSDEPSNLQGLCKGCHSRKTALVDGGWARRRGA